MDADARTARPANDRAQQAKPKISKTPAAGSEPRKAPALEKPVGQIVLVLQGGGALGAYQAGVYQGLMEGGIEPEWVIGTSIGAINGAIIAGNPPRRRLERLREFWGRLGNRRVFDEAWSAAFSAGAFANLHTLTQGVPGFFEANPQALWGVHLPVGIERAAFYTTEPLKRTLDELVDFGHLNGRRTRLTVGAVNVRTGEMRYFDSRDMELGPGHIMASGALPPGFPAVRIEGEPYWDGGLYSNTPVEVVLDDNPRRDSLIVSVNMWQPSGSEPGTIWQVLGRQKDIQYASRGKSHVMRQEQIHRLRHVIRELGKRLSDAERDDPEVRELLGYGCGTTMHLVRLLSPRLDSEDHTKDIDFTRAGIRTRWQAGYQHALRVIAEKPWICHIDPLQGVLIHESSED
jgi:NTE family protein